MYSHRLHLSSNQWMGIWYLHVEPIKDRTITDIHLYPSMPMYIFIFPVVVEGVELLSYVVTQAFLKLYFGSGRVALTASPRPKWVADLHTESRRALQGSWLSKGLDQGPHVKPSEWNLTHRRYLINITYSLLSFSWLLRIIQNWGP